MLHWPGWETVVSAGLATINMLFQACGSPPLDDLDQWLYLSEPYLPSQGNEAEASDLPREDSGLWVKRAPVGYRCLIHSFSFTMLSVWP